MACKTLGFCSLRTSKKSLHVEGCFHMLPNPNVSNDKMHTIVCIKEHMTSYEVDLRCGPIPLAKNLKSLKLWSLDEQWGAATNDSNNFTIGCYIIKIYKECLGGKCK